MGAHHHEGAAVDDELAFARLADANLDATCRLATLIFGGDRAEAEDAVQDAAVRAWQHFDDLRDRASFKPWFTRIVVNTCRDRLKARRLGSVTVVSLDPGTVPDPAEALSGADALVRAMLALSLEHRVVVALRFLGDYSLTEIAALTGQRVGTVKSRLHYALRALRATLDAEAREVSR